MKIHSDKLTSVDVYLAAAWIPGVYPEANTVGSRSRRHGIVVKLESDGTPDQHGNRRNRRTNGGTRGAGFDRPNAASWADWGHVLGYLYALDPALVTPYYRDRADFTTRTGGRFEYAYVDGVDDRPWLTETSAERLKISSVDLSAADRKEHGWSE